MTWTVKCLLYDRVGTELKSREAKRTPRAGRACENISVKLDNLIVRPFSGEPQLYVIEDSTGRTLCCKEEQAECTE